MTSNNAAEIRRVRIELSARANHDVRKLFVLLAPLRARYLNQLVNHGMKADQSAAPKRELPVG